MVTIADLLQVKVKYYSLINRIRDAVSGLNSVDVVTPINAGVEKEKWIKKVRKGYFVNPQFWYNVPLLKTTISRRGRLSSLESELSSIEPRGEAEQFVLNQLMNVVQDGIDTTNLAESILFPHDDELLEIVIRKYGVPDEKNTRLALDQVMLTRESDCFEQKTESLVHTCFKDEKNFDAEGIREILDWAMRQYGKCWPIEINPNYTSINACENGTIGHPMIVIPENIQVSGLKLAELIGHKIDCHWRSSINAGLIGIPKCDDEFVYEGLAALKDKEFSRNYHGNFNHSSVYYLIAIKEALQAKSFANVSAFIYDCLPVSLGEDRAAMAWHYTYSVFRGITDIENSHGYAFTKDRVYFEGYLFAKEVSDDGKADFLSFSTLDRNDFERLMNIVSIDDIRNSVMLDKNIQEVFLRQLL